MARNLPRVLLLWMICQGHPVCAQTQPWTTVSHRDINGDGFEDVLAKTCVSANVKEGKATVYQSRCTLRIYHGHTGGLSLQPGIVVEDNAGIAAMTGIKDLNHDGFGDSTVSSQSELRLFFGSENGYRDTPDITYQVSLPEKHQWNQVFYDYNGDGIPDMIMQSYRLLPSLSATVKADIRVQVVPGSTGEVHPPAIPLGELDDKEVTFSGNHDFNRDGREDLLLNFTDKGVLRAMIWLGAAGREPGIRDWKAWKPPYFGLMDGAFVGAGDVNGDKASDLAVLTRATKQSTRRQQAPPFTLSVFPGGAGGLGDTAFFKLPITGLSPTYVNFTQIKVGAAGDLDGDGFGDLFVCGYGPKGMILWGGVQGMTVSVVDINVLLGLPAESRPSIASAGDVNGDRLADLVVYHADRLWVIYGNRGRGVSMVAIGF